MWIFAGTITWILYLLVCIAGYTLFYLTENVQVASFSQLLYTLQVSMGGAENTIWQIVGGFFEKMWLQVLLATLLYIGFMTVALRRRKMVRKNMPVSSLLKMESRFSDAAVFSAASFYAEFSEPKSIPAMICSALENTLTNAQQFRIFMRNSTFLFLSRD